MVQKQLKNLIKTKNTMQLEDVLAKVLNVKNGKEKIKHFVSKDALNIDGFRKKR